jgi:hypothetical protein
VTRPSDWAPLAGSDPVPGDPAQIQTISRRHGDLAEELQAQANTLRRLSDADGWDADAGRRFSSTGREIGDNLDKARRRYTAVAAALNGYAPQLEEAQRQADAALRDAKAAQSTITTLQPAGQPASYPSGSSGSASYSPASYTPASSGSSGSSGSDQAAPDPAQVRQLDDAQSALSGARQRLANAVQLHDDAGRRAASQIRAATQHDGLKDSWWDKVKGWTSDRWDSFIKFVHEHADFLSQMADVAGWMATALSVIALAISFIPVLDFLTPVLLAAATIITVISLVCHVLLALSGDGSWVDVGFDLIGLATMGYGSVAARGAKASEQVVKTVATRTVRKAGEKAIRDAAAGATRTTGRQISAAARTAAKSQARRSATRAAKAAVKEAAETKSSLAQKLANLDGEAAQQEAGIKAMAALAPGSVRAAAASKAALGGMRKVVVSTGISIMGDVADKTKAADPIKPALTFGRYANAGG